MPSLLGVNEELKVFKCPCCRQYISSKNDACPKCSFQLPNELKQAAINSQDEEVKEANRKFYKNLLIAGIGIFALGAVLLAQSVITIFYTERGLFYTWSPVLTLIGIGQIIYSLNGLRKER